MASAAEKARVNAINSRLANASSDWQLGKVGLELVAVVTPGTEPVTIADLTPDCGYVDRDFLLHAHEDISFLLMLLKRAAEEIRKWKPVEHQRQDHAHAKGDFTTECAMLCKEQSFRRFLLEVTGAKDVSDEIRVNSHVRHLLKIDSRSEINTDAGARNRWLDLRAKYKAWMRVVA